MEEIKENIETQESQEMQENGMPKVESTFEELGVSGEILRAIREMGYETPMPVQEKVIPYLLGHNNDVDGKFGNNTRRDTIELQKKLNLNPDGVAGYNSIQEVFYN